MATPCALCWPAGLNLCNSMLALRRAGRLPACRRPARLNTACPRLPAVLPGSLTCRKAPTQYPGGFRLRPPASPRFPFRVIYCLAGCLNFFCCVPLRILQGVSRPAPGAGAKTAPRTAKSVRTPLSARHTDAVHEGACYCAIYLCFFATPNCDFDSPPVCTHLAKIFMPARFSASIAAFRPSAAGRSH